MGTGTFVGWNALLLHYGFGLFCCYHALLVAIVGIEQCEQLLQVRLLLPRLFCRRLCRFRHSHVAGTRSFPRLGLWLFLFRLRIQYLLLLFLQLLFWLHGCDLGGEESVALGGCHVLLKLLHSYSISGHPGTKLSTTYSFILFLKHALLRIITASWRT